ncbi:MAG: DNA-processing protein DprA [Candidatus Marinimicrobia bacterium]|jgi:DNA processing protein|nr:DNA-processing protein DprA [Candidatus Neomarinimicrobiota bacterium]MDD5062674.1 DNA-processing protein DprA [Candidatus Neomarinimicrobiota bacterium]
MDRLHALLSLLTINGLGPHRILNLCRQYPDIQEVFNTNLKRLMAVPGIDMVLAERIKNNVDQQFVDQQLNMLKNSPFKITTILDDDYPVRLKDIYDPPVVLFRHGEFSPQDEDAIAIVGTRNPDHYGKEVATLLVSQLVEQNITIVSGFARGIDTIAHKTALEKGGRTIAVLGNGIDRIYPPENRLLREKLVGQGVYCSEFPFGTKPDAVNFPRRNRIISGLSLGTVVISAGEKSGALLTAYYALDQNREVFAIPGRITDEKSVGTNRLIQKGAKLVTAIDDILDEIDVNRRFPRQPHQLEIVFEFEDEEEKAIYNALSNDPIYIDDLAHLLGKNTYSVLATLLSLELKGAVRQLAGKMFIKAG